ncbi:TPA: hypothetical protein NBK19_003744 [Acinetobacter baumannii]|uniref:hypothetical protein n=1 Tax=Acinetobacter TaxID=469 RepID=UPI0034D3B6BD|nr:hypothetical protein [Acinetobacter baumannii]
MTYIVIGIALILIIIFINKFYSYKNSMQLTLRPMKEWVILCKGVSSSEREAMCHALLEETSSMLEQSGVISKSDFKKLYTKPEIYFSNYVQITLLITHDKYFSQIQSRASYSDQQARLYLAHCFIVLYENGLGTGHGGEFYYGKDVFNLLGKVSSSVPSNTWDFQLN